mgnify:CR=1 FL=1
MYPVVLTRLDRAGEEVEETFTVKSVDGTTQGMTVTINGTNDAAVIGGAIVGTVVEDTTLSVSGALTVSDVDTGEASFQAQTGAGSAGGYGTFTVVSNVTLAGTAVMEVSRGVGQDELNLTGTLALGGTLLACTLSSLLLFAYWGLFTWLPNILASPVAQGGAGMSIVKSTAYIVPMQLGAFAGYLSFGPLADRFGRRRTFAFFTVTAAIIVPVYLRMMTTPTMLMVLGPVLGWTMDRFGPQRMIRIGVMLFGAGFILLSQMLINMWALNVL